MVDVKEFKDDPLYKALENSGFSAEDIATMVENGDVTFEKSKSVADMKESEKKEDKNMTAKVTFNTERCKGCELCVSVCPKHIVAIDTAVTNRKGYHPAGVTDMAACIACASCAKICPDSIITVERF